MSNEKHIVKLTSQQLISLQNLHLAIEEILEFIQNRFSEIPTDELEEYAETLNYILDNSEISKSEPVISN
jgi:hypothetical protein